MHVELEALFGGANDEFQSCQFGIVADPKEWLENIDQEATWRLASERPVQFCQVLGRIFHLMNASRFEESMKTMPSSHRALKMAAPMHLVWKASETESPRVMCIDSKHATRR
ncbi:hypothetical protein TgHK011_004885 [Trichoderma gracile]|nr:hypothetical protein TgHK011_004885 [Trichoderma gracile]